MPSGIFISYRREDAAGDAGRLADHLQRRFGRARVFLDVDGIAPGTRWEDVPETWTCPDCGVTKSDFEMVEL